MISLPFDSENTGYDEQGYPIYDRASNSEQLRTMLGKNFTDGVYPNPSTQFQVSTGTDMTVTVNPGACNIQGAFAYETVNRVLTVQASDTTYDRIDRVVLRLNTNTAYRNIDLYVVEGTPANIPVAPTLTRTSSMWEIGLANLFIAKNTTSISASRITDTRLDSDVCGVVSGTVQSVDTSSIFAQYQAALDEYLELVERAISDTEAGYLQNQINGILGNLATVYDSTSTYAVGDYCIYDSKLYKCTTAIATAEAWTSAHWTVTDCGSEFKTLNSNLDNLNKVIIGTLTVPDSANMTGYNMQAYSKNGIGYVTGAVSYNPSSLAADADYTFAVSSIIPKSKSHFAISNGLGYIGTNGNIMCNFKSTYTAGTIIPFSIAFRI